MRGGGVEGECFMQPCRLSFDRPVLAWRASGSSLARVSSTRLSNQPTTCPIPLHPCPSLPQFRQAMFKLEFKARQQLESAARAAGKRPGSAGSEGDLQVGWEAEWCGSVGQRCGSV